MSDAITAEHHEPGTEPETDQPGLDEVRNAVHNRTWIRLELETVVLPSLALAALTIALAVILPYTRISNLGRLIAVVFPTFVVLLLDLDQVTLVRDSGVIPQGIPLPRLPPLTAFTPEVITGAAAVAVIILVQSAGVSQSVPNPDGSVRNRSRDFTAIGAANWG